MEAWLMLLNSQINGAQALNSEAVLTVVKRRFLILDLQLENFSAYPCIWNDGTWEDGLKDLKIYVCACACIGLRMNFFALGMGGEWERETFIKCLC